MYFLYCNVDVFEPFGLMRFQSAYTLVVCSEFLHFYIFVEALCFAQLSLVQSCDSHCVGRLSYAVILCLPNNRVFFILYSKEEKSKT